MDGTVGQYHESETMPDPDQKGTHNHRKNRRPRGQQTKPQIQERRCFRIFPRIPYPYPFLSRLHSLSLFLYVNLSPSSLQITPLSTHRRTRRVSRFPSNLGISIEAMLSEADQERLIDKLGVFKIQGRDKRGRNILRVIGHFFPARIVSVDLVKKYLEEKIFPKLEQSPFSVLYVHTDVQRSENFPGISALRSIYDSIPINVRQNLKTVYFVHPGLQARLFLATFGRLMFSGGFYGKLTYVSTLDLLWEHLRRNEIEIPGFVYDHDEDLEYRPMMDYGLESDHPRVYGAPATDSPAPMYSMRCIS